MREFGQRRPAVCAKPPGCDCLQHSGRQQWLAAHRSLAVFWASRWLHKHIVSLHLPSGTTRLTVNPPIVKYDRTGQGE